jgi:hypothetical protein
MRLILAPRQIWCHRFCGQLTSESATDHDHHHHHHGNALPYKLLLAQTSNRPKGHQLCLITGIVYIKVAA